MHIYIYIYQNSFKPQRISFLFQGPYGRACSRHGVTDHQQGFAHIRILERQFQRGVRSAGALCNRHSAVYRWRWVPDVLSGASRRGECAKAQKQSEFQQ